MILLTDSFIDFINENEIEFESMELTLLKNYIEKLERKEI